MPAKGLARDAQLLARFADYSYLLTHDLSPDWVSAHGSADAPVIEQDGQFLPGYY
jgi:hypothetical protein